MQKDQEILNIVLEQEKNLVKNYATAITEASNEKIEGSFEKIFNETKELQREIFDYMNAQGWYKLEYATLSKIEQEEKKNSQVLENLEEI